MFNKPEVLKDIDTEIKLLTRLKTVVLGLKMTGAKVTAALKPKLKVVSKRKVRKVV